MQVLSGSWIPSLRLLALQQSQRLNTQYLDWGVSQRPFPGAFPRLYSPKQSWCPGRDHAVTHTLLKSIPGVWVTHPPFLGLSPGPRGGQSATAEQEPQNMSLTAQYNLAVTGWKEAVVTVGRADVERVRPGKAPGAR